MNPEQDDPKSEASAYQLFMLGLCIYVLIAIAAQTFLRLPAGANQILNIADTAICFVFLGDFAVSLSRSKHKLKYLQWGWIDLISSIPMLGILRWGRMARVIRILRVLRGVRSTKYLVAYLLKRRADGAFAAVALVSILMIIFGSIAILQLENAEASNIKGPEDALWWAFVTITTVGYGDKYPVTMEGRIVATFLMTMGVGLFGTFTGFVASWFLKPGEDKSEDEIEKIKKELQEIRCLLEKNSRSPGTL